MDPSQAGGGGGNSVASMQRIQTLQQELQKEYQNLQQQQGGGGGGGGGPGGPVVSTSAPMGGPGASVMGMNQQMMSGGVAGARMMRPRGPVPGQQQQPQAGLRQVRSAGRKHVEDFKHLFHYPDVFFSCFQQILQQPRGPQAFPRQPGPGGPAGMMRPGLMRPQQHQPMAPGSQMRPGNPQQQQQQQQGQQQGGQNDPMLRELLG